MARTRNFADVLRKKVAADPQLAAAVAEAGFQANVAEQIYYARTEAGLTQSELADQIGSQQSVIARMEDADYEGHSISMLRRIAHATGKELCVTFKDKQAGIAQAGIAVPAASVEVSATARMAIASRRLPRLKSPPPRAERPPAASKRKSAAPARKKKRNA
jgi:transcriptional regulator with XRE-family HTH domain